jgi:hypothetical protein
MNLQNSISTSENILNSLPDRFALTGPIIISSFYIKLLIIIIIALIGYFTYQFVRGEIYFCKKAIDIGYGSERFNIAKKGRKRTFNPMNIKTIDNL